MLYFSKQLGNSDAFDQDQYAKLERLKKNYESRGLYDIYDSDSDLKDKFYRQLEIKVNEHEIFQFRREEMNSGLGPEELDSRISQLSDTAKIILKAVSQDSQGLIWCYANASGTFIQTEDNMPQGKNIIPDQDSRIVAQWRAALNELTTANLLEEINDRGEIFRITYHGYNVADIIEVAT